MRHDRVEGHGVELHVAHAGEGPPVLLLHGFPEHWATWRSQIAALARAGFSAFAPDLRGYNLSERPEGRAAYDLRLLVEDVAALAREAARRTGHTRAHVVGHDWGDVVAWAFAGAHPALLGRLVVMNAPHPRLYAEQVRRPPQLLRSWYVAFFQLPALPELALSARSFAAVRGMFRALPSTKGALTDAEVDEFVAALARPGALTAALNYYRAAVREPGGLGPALRARTEAEALVIWGERDPALSVQLLDGLERVAPRARVHRLPGVGHWVQREAAAEVNRALVDFLRG